MSPLRLVAWAALLAAQEGPTFEGVGWVDGAPDLKGKVALVRWWTQG
jgi:hypothetical protein